MSKNAITIDQLIVACRHVTELMDVGVTENFAIRTLELFADFYAKLYYGGSATPHHIDQVELWSLKARKLRENNLSAKPKDFFRVEHGTPRRQFARLVLDLYQKNSLNRQTMNLLVEKYWKLAVITLEEDQNLNKIARSAIFESPFERWSAANIQF